MFYALADGRLVDAQPGARATCPLCRAIVTAKCGRLVEWHWAHVGDYDCDPWTESETPWHRWWKERAPVDWREVTMGDLVKHRADIRRPDDGYVIELQHSPLSVDQIREREDFYRRMVWLLDGRMLTRLAWLFDTWVPRFEQVRPGTWLWLWPKRSFRHAQKKVFIDLGRNVIEVMRFEEVPRGERRRLRASGFYVHGLELTREQFLARAKLGECGASPLSTISLIAEWRTPTTKEHSSELSKDVLRRREFRTESGLQRWMRAKERAELTVMRWRDDGALVEDDDFSERAEETGAS